MNRLLRALAPVLILAAAAQPTLASAQDSVRIAYADLDLASPHGLVALDRRIARAADTLCATANDRFGYAVRSAQRACRREIADSVHAQLDARQTTPVFTTK
ncbi:MAG: UrcA family protein [Sphingomonas sp.]|nr:UrcA family protein [Sphingomonas sp.]